MLCILRRLRQKDDKVNSFLAGFLSGVASISMVQDVQFRKMLGLYTLVRSFKVYLDIQESKGKVTESQLEKAFTTVFYLSVFGLLMIFMFAYNTLQPDRYMFLDWIFTNNNQPNDQIFAAIIRFLCKV